MHFTKTMFQKRNFKKRVDIFRQQAYLECKLLQNRNSQTNNPHFEETVTFLKHLYPIHIIYCFCNLRLSQQRGEILTLKTYLKIHPDDLVAVALAPLSAGTVVEIQDQTVTLKEDIPQGHKFALADIRARKACYQVWFSNRSCKRGHPMRCMGTHTQYKDRSGGSSYVHLRAKRHAGDPDE